MSFVSFTVENDIATITLNRPEAFNALSIQLLDEYMETLQTLRNHGSCRVILLTGAGDQAFCSGADLKERRQMSIEQAKAAVQKIGDVIRATEQMPQPVIAVINGVAFGGGLELALACDFRVASTTAKLGLTEVSLGIIPGAGGTQRLPRLIGIAKAKELIYTAKKLTAEEAMRYGIVEHIFVPELLMEQSIQLAEEMTNLAPLALIQAKHAIQEGMQVSVEEGLRIEKQCYQTLIETEDRQEGLRAFEEKRSPNFNGR